MSGTKKPSPRSLRARELLAEIILNANALRVLARKWAFDLDQMTDLKMIQEDLSGMRIEMEGK